MKLINLLWLGFVCSFVWGQGRAHLHSTQLRIIVLCQSQACLLTTWLLWRFAAFDFFKNCHLLSTFVVFSFCFCFWGFKSAVLLREQFTEGDLQDTDFTLLVVPYFWPPIEVGIAVLLNVVIFIYVSSCSYADYVSISLTMQLCCFVIFKLCHYFL